MNNIYPMICSSCSEQFELEMKVSEYSNGKHTCPKCGSGDVGSDFSVKRGVIVDDQSRFRKGELKERY